jgi:uncharacterized membrane protein YhaH (DUF805 family)
VRARFSITAIANALSFAGRMERRPYLVFLCAAICTLVLGTLALTPVLDSAGSAFIIMVVALYWPVTAAGVRRLRDAGLPGHLMLRPLLPVVTLALAGFIFVFAARQAFAAFYLAVLAFGPLLKIATAVAVLTAVIATLVLISDTMSSLLLPSMRDEGV